MISLSTWVHTPVVGQTQRSYLAPMMTNLSLPAQVFASVVVHPVLVTRTRRLSTPWPRATRSPWTQEIPALVTQTKRFSATQLRLARLRRPRAVSALIADPGRFGAHRVDSVLSLCTAGSCLPAPASGHSYVLCADSFFAALRLLASIRR